MPDTALRPRPAFNPEHVQFYNIEMGRLADGMISVAITATTCPYDDELVTQALHSDRDRKSTRLNSSHIQKSRMPSSA